MSLSFKTLVERDLILRTIRQFFYERGFVEVQCPLLAGEIAPEANIKPFMVCRSPSQFQGYLITSPELFMKRLLCTGAADIFHISPVFRQEEYSDIHLPEFTLLEWYRIGADYYDLMSDCEELLLTCCSVAASESAGPCVEFKGHKVLLDRPFKRLTVREAFRRYAGWEPGPCPDEYKFDLDMVTRVEPALSEEGAVFLYDWPASMASLSRLKADEPDVAERVELYVAGLELANGFSELADPAEQRRRFEEEIEKIRKSDDRLCKMPVRFLDDMKDMPESVAGMALGVDRLIMLLLGKERISDVVCFPNG